MHCFDDLPISDFTDLYDYSCLNGWTMGNIAVAPKVTPRHTPHTTRH